MSLQTFLLFHLFNKVYISRVKITSWNKTLLFILLLCVNYVQKTKLILLCTEKQKMCLTLHSRTSETYCCCSLSITNHDLILYWYLIFLYTEWRREIFDSQSKNKWSLKIINHELRVKKTKEKSKRSEEINFGRSKRHCQVWCFI